MKKIISFIIAAVFAVGSAFAANDKLDFEGVAGMNIANVDETECHSRIGRRLRLGRLASRPSGEGVRRRCRAAVDGDVRRGPEGEEACRRAGGAVGVHAAEPPRGRALSARRRAAVL